MSVHPGSDLQPVADAVDAPIARQSEADWASEWVERNNAAANRQAAKRRGFKPLPETLTAFQRSAVNLLREGFATGIYNVSTNWEKVDWDFGNGVCFVIGWRGLATYDFDHLTRLVIGAHDRSIRLDIDARARNYLALMMWPRSREGGMAQRHPTIEEAIARFRGADRASTTDSPTGPGMNPENEASA